MSTSMRAKFVITGIVKMSESSEEVKFAGVPKTGSYPEDGSDEDNTFAKFSPAASCAITIQNPNLIGKFNVGEKFYVDFTPVAK